MFLSKLEFQQYSSRSPDFYLADPMLIGENLAGYISDRSPNAVRRTDK